MLELVVFFVIFLLLYLVFHSVTEALVLIFPTIYAMTGGLLLQWYLHYNFSVAVAVGYIALFGIAVETGVVMVVYLHEALERKIRVGECLTNADVEAAAIEGAVQRLRPKLMTILTAILTLFPLALGLGAGAEMQRPLAIAVIGGLSMSTLFTLILAPTLYSAILRGRYRA